MLLEDGSESFRRETARLCEIQSAFFSSLLDLRMVCDNISLGPGS
jgi:hypothetical protein